MATWTNASTPTITDSAFALSPGIGEALSYIKTDWDTAGTVFFDGASKTNASLVKYDSNTQSKLETQFGKTALEWYLISNAGGGFVYWTGSEWSANNYTSNYIAGFRY